MNIGVNTHGKYSSAEKRWAGLGPYYAMFPTTFADFVVSEYSSKGDTVLDPFAGRGTSLFSSVTAGRMALGMELNPVGWIYSQTKLSPSPMDQVLARITELEEMADAHRREAYAMPLFFRRCYSPGVRAFLLCARSELKWQTNHVDRTVMAFLLTHLHGKLTDSLSNQMRQTKSMAPNYAVKWWTDHGFVAPNIKIKDFFTKKLQWRYAKGVPTTVQGTVLLGDSVDLTASINGKLDEFGVSQPSLIFTSPPYFGITNYHYDQWIRLWLLGGPPTDRRTRTEFNGKHRGKFSNLEVYKQLLTTVFSNSAKIVRTDAVVYVRTDRREPTASLTKAALREAFPEHKMRQVARPIKGKTQTGLFGYASPKIGEIDLILTR